MGKLHDAGRNLPRESDPPPPLPPLTELTADAPLFGPAWQLYEASFPRDHRRTLTEQRRALADARYRFVAAGTPEVVAVYGAWSLPECSFIEHLAVRPDRQAQGLGSRLMRAVLAGADLAVLEIEPLHDPASTRRLAFYERLGFRHNPFAYEQPPYGPGRCGVPMLLLSHPRALAAEEFARVRRSLEREVYGLAESAADLR